MIMIHTYFTDTPLFFPYIILNTSNYCEAYGSAYPESCSIAECCEDAPIGQKAECWEPVGPSPNPSPPTKMPTRPPTPQPTSRPTSQPTEKKKKKKRGGKGSKGKKKNGGRNKNKKNKKDSSSKDSSGLFGSCRTAAQTCDGNTDCCSGLCLLSTTPLVSRVCV